MPNAGSCAGFLPLKLLYLRRFCFAHCLEAVRDRATEPCVVVVALDTTNHPAKGPVPPGSILFSVPVGIHAFKIKKDKQEKEGAKQGTSHLLAVRKTTWLLSQAQVMALGFSFARAAYLPLRC